MIQKTRPFDLTRQNVQVDYWKRTDQIDGTPEARVSGSSWWRNKRVSTLGLLEQLLDLDQGIVEVPDAVVNSCSGQGWTISQTSCEIVSVTRKKAIQSVVASGSSSGCTRTYEAVLLATKQVVHHTSGYRIQNTNQLYRFAFSKAKKDSMLHICARCVVLKKTTSVDDPVDLDHVCEPNSFVEEMARSHTTCSRRTGTVETTDRNSIANSLVSSASIKINARKYRERAKKSRQNVPDTMSANDQLSFLAGLTGAPEAEMVDEDGQDVEEMYGDMEYSLASSSEPETIPNRFDPPEENLVFFTETNESSSMAAATDLSMFEKEKKLAKIVQNLQFSAPGEQMISGGSGVRRARQKKACDAPESLFHDSEGRLVVNGQSWFICDCLDPLCNGCHSDCPECHGKLCGPSCQKGRLDVVLKKECSSGQTIYNPYVKS